MSVGKIGKIGKDLWILFCFEVIVER